LHFWACGVFFHIPFVNKHNFESKGDLPAAVVDVLAWFIALEPELND